MPIKLTDCKKYFDNKHPHQVVAVRWLGELLLNTPAKDRLQLTDSESWLECSDEELYWLQRQISDTTLDVFTEKWRNELVIQSTITNPQIFSQRDNSVLPYTTCSSSSHAMYVDYILRKRGSKGLSNDEGYLHRVFSGRYGKFGSNPSVSWDIQSRVCNSYGVKSKYIWDGNFTNLHKEIEKNDVTVINIFHKGSSKATRGGGHVVLLAGYDEDKELYHIYDPFGTRPPSYSFKIGSKLAQLDSQTQMTDDVLLLMKLALAEARGEGLEGMALVIRTTLNRLNLTRHSLQNYNTREKTVKGIIYAPWQYEPTWSDTNNIKDVWGKVTPEVRNLAKRAYHLAIKPNELRVKVKEAYQLSEDDSYKIVRSSFFAAKTHPQAISPYIEGNYILAKNQIFGADSVALHVPAAILFEDKGLDPLKLAEPAKIYAGVYDMDKVEFNWRWQGCWRQLLD